jgi:hypothetical protein
VQQYSMSVGAGIGGCCASGWTVVRTNSACQKLFSWMCVEYEWLYDCVQAAVCLKRV